MAGRAVPASHPAPRVAPSALALLDAAKQELAVASAATTPNARYAAAHLAALRGAAAVLAARARLDTSRKRPRSAWALLPEVAPAMTEWAMFFGAGARKRAAAEAGLPRAVTAREADDLLRDAEAFVALIEETLGQNRGP